jgi:ATP-binding cassette subfamily C protein
VELFPGSIKENVCRMRDDLPDDKIYEAAVVAGVHDLICHLPQGYETVLEGGGTPLSGGERQRIALARAFFDNPAVIVLDEPNSNLDGAGEQALGDSLRRAKARGVTVVVITQRPALLESVDKVLILKGGRAAAFGTVDQVLRRPAASATRAQTSEMQPGPTRRRARKRANGPNVNTPQEGSH